MLESSEIKNQVLQIWVDIILKRGSDLVSARCLEQNKIFAELKGMNHDNIKWKLTCNT